MRCIFCLEERAPSREHVFPESIGGTFVIDRVCKTCNERLGAKVDCKLSDHLACLVVREQLGMIDGVGRPVRSWPRFFREGVLAADQTRTIEIRQDRETGRFNAKLRPHSRAITSPEGVIGEEISIDLSDIDQLPKIVQRRRKRAGLKPMSEPEIEALMNEARMNICTIERPELIHYSKVDIENYKLAIAKIAYEMAWHWLGDVYLADARAMILRDYILGRRDNLPVSYIEFKEDHAGFAPWASEPNAHIALGVSQARSHAIALRIFGIFIGVVEITSANERYGDIAWNRFLLIDPATGMQRASSLNAEIAFVVRKERQARRTTTDEQQSLTF